MGRYFLTERPQNSGAPSPEELDARQRSVKVVLISDPPGLFRPEILPRKRSEGGRPVFRTDPRSKPEHPRTEAFHTRHALGYSLPCPFLHFIDDSFDPLESGFSPFRGQFP